MPSDNILGLCADKITFLQMWFNHILIFFSSPPGRFTDTMGIGTCRLDDLNLHLIINSVFYKPVFSVIKPLVKKLQCNVSWICNLHSCTLYESCVRCNTGVWRSWMKAFGKYLWPANITQIPFPLRSRWGAVTSAVWDWQCEGLFLHCHTLWECFLLFQVVKLGVSSISV